MAISTAVDNSAVARVLGIKTTFKDLRTNSVMFLPQHIAVIGQGNSDAVYTTTKTQVTSASQAASLYGFGSPIHLAVRELFPSDGSGVGTIPVTIYPLEDAATGVAAVGNITPSGTQTKAAQYRVLVNKIKSEYFTISAGATVAQITAAITTAINAVLAMPVVATDDSTKVTLTSKWKGLSANDIYVEVSGSTTAGTAFAVTQPTGGLVNPDITDVLTQVGNVWVSMIVNCLNPDDEDALDALSTFGETRWGALVRKPLIAFVGSNATTSAAAVAITDTRKDDRTNVQLVAPGSKNLPLVIAAAQVAKIAIVANNNPARDYGSQEVTSLTAGDDGDQWLYTERDYAVKHGSSTIEVVDDVINISDVVTMYHPTDEDVPAYRYVCDIVKLQTILYNLNLKFATAEWDGAPLIPDDQPTVNPYAKKPKDAVSVVCALIDNLGNYALISDPAYAKEHTQAAINDQNPKRLDVTTTVKLSGNTNIKSIDLNFGFYYGSA